MNDQKSSLKISVITPNYNYGHYINRTIESVLDQDYECIEHIIVDDGSTDDSVNIIQSYAKNYPEKVRLIVQSNQGQTKAINVGLRNITGDIIAWINSDDWYCENVFGRIKEIFYKNPHIDIVYGNYYNMDTEGNLRFLYKDIKFSYFMACMVGFGQIMASNTVFWRRQLMKEAGYLDESFSYAMDNEYFSRITKGSVIKKVKFPIAHFRFHAQSKTGIHKQNKVQSYSDEIRQVARKAYKNLRISKVIPYEKIRVLKFLARGYRILLRFISGHYIPKIKYYFKSKKRKSEST